MSKSKTNSAKCMAAIACSVLALAGLPGCIDEQPGRENATRDAAEPTRPAGPGAGDEGRIVSPQILIRVRDGVDPLKAARAIGGVSVSEAGAGWYGVVLAEGVSVEEALERARRSDLIAAAEPNREAGIPTPQN